MNAGLVLALIGIGFSTILAQTSKHYSVSGLAKMLAGINLVLCIALIWRVAIDIGWWVIPAFIIVSLISGFISATIRIRHSAGDAILYATQSLQGFIIIALTATAWHLR